MIWLKKAVPRKGVITFFFGDAELFVLVGREELFDREFAALGDKVPREICKSMRFMNLQL
jgi:hypothetical protein